MTDTAGIARSRTSNRKWPAWLLSLVVVSTVVGLGLRIAAARGDLWLDEIESVGIVRGVSLARVFFGLPVDNNHVLNSAWLWFLGDDPTPLLARLPAVLFGTLCVPVAAMIGARRNAFAGAVAAVIVATDGLLVHFGSEARGYSGMILATFVALDALEAYMDDPSRRGRLAAFAVAVGLGTFSQYTMVASSGALVAAALARACHDHGYGRRAWSAFRPVLDATVRGTIPAFACLVVSMYVGRQSIGEKTPFSVDTLVGGLSRLASATLGMPSGPNVAFLVVAGLLAAVAVLATPPGRRGFPIAAIFAVTAARVLVHVPNEQFARFHFTVAIGLVFLAVEMAALADASGRRARYVAAFVAILATVGDVAYDVSLAGGGRGSYSVPVAAMVADGRAAVAVRSPNLFGETSMVLSFHDRSGTLTPVNGCGSDPRWLLVVTDPNAPAAATTASATECDGRRYVLHGEWASMAVSGYTWALYERVPKATAKLSGAEQLEERLRVVVRDR